MGHQKWREIEKYATPDIQLEEQGSPMKITHVKFGQRGASRQNKRLVTVCAELAGPQEFMTITVAVSNDGTDSETWERAIARAKNFARTFAASPLQEFPSPALARLSSW